MTSVHEYLAPDQRPCICSICTCGHHHCPGLMRHMPLEGCSHYREHYVPKQSELGDRPSPRRQQAPPMTKAPPGHFTTTSQAAAEGVKNAPIDKTASCRPRAAPLVPTDFNGDTTYHHDYPGHQPPPLLRSVPQQSRMGPKGVGTYETTNGVMQAPVAQAVKDGTMQRPEPSRRPEGLKSPRQEFNGVTTYTDHYVPKQGDHDLKSPRRPQGLPPGPESRDFQTTKGASYPPPPQRLRVCPASLAPRRPPSTDGHIKVLNPQTGEFEVLVDGTRVAVPAKQ